MRLLCLLAISSLLLFTIGCTHLVNDNWTGKDKVQHFIASAATAAAGSAYGTHQNWNEARCRSFGLAFSTGIGAAKELYDSRAGRYRLELEGLYLGCIGRSSGLWPVPRHPLIFDCFRSLSSNA